MDEKKIFIVNLSKGRMGETNASLLGSMLVVKIYLAAMSRADEPPIRMAKLPRFYFYVDEFQSMMNEAFADILSESRKYKLALTLANQYIEQMEENVRDAVFGNVGTLIVFRVGPFDAEVLETVFEPTFTPEDLVGLGIGQIYLTLMINGVGSRPFSAETIPPIEQPSISYRDDVIENSRAQYARPRAEIDALVQKRQTEFVQPPKAPKPRKEYGPQSNAKSAHDRRSTDLRTEGGAGGTTYGTRPRPAPYASVGPQRNAPASVMSHTPRPAPFPPQFSASASSEETRKSALRAALERARTDSSEGHKKETVRAALSMSPADILRTRLSASPAGALHAGGQPRQADMSGNTHAEHRPIENAPKDNPSKSNFSGEVSNELLRSVLHTKGDSGDK